MEKNPVDSEENNDSSEDGRESMKVWLQENLRMIVSIAIVVVIAGGIYSYSKRTQAPAVQEETAVTEEGAEGKISVIGGETQQNQEEAAGETAKPETTQPATPQEAQSAPAAQQSKETDSAFQETAARGDSTTKLARRALANYLEKSPDATLTAEHKIYIEDFLRRQVKDGRLKVGESREFTKDIIANAIQKSKGLNEKQLKNLEKYSQKVPGLK
ncbi:MAG: hypothetical protein A3J76_00315 [Candidatus Moranbacteria bacterium RBG_13_45_13]|nr:MAG: hypothetical protein A3J76_00315 [Candidatus Moranbacteria bacterium RBG_13_45_13]